MKEPQAQVAAPLLPFAGTSFSSDQLESSRWRPHTTHGVHPSHVDRPPAADGPLLEVPPANP